MTDPGAFVTTPTGERGPLVEAVLARWTDRTTDPDFIAYEVRKWAREFTLAGYSIVRTQVEAHCACGQAARHRPTVDCKVIYTESGPTCAACDGTGVLRTSSWDEEGFPCPECGGLTGRFPENEAGHACRRDAIVDGVCIDCERPPKAEHTGGPEGADDGR